MVVISRGGAGIWYQNITTNYVDLFDFYTPEQFRTKNADRLRENKQKHLALTDFDREILKLAYQHLGAQAGGPAAPDVHVPALLSVLEEPDVDQPR